MADSGPLTRAVTVDISLEPPGSADARKCLDAYFEELARRFETGFDPDQSTPAHEDDLTPPAGYFVVARLGGQVVGCGALKIGGEGFGEIKRLWTASSVRGQGIARDVLDFLEAKARELGLTKLRLDTNKALHEAQALYRRSGYREVGRFNDNPYAHHWFEKQL